MSKVKFVLDPAPTFKATVNIPVHGGETAPVVFEFKHRDREALEVFTKGVGDRPVEESVLEVAVGWELDDPFDAESVKKLCKNYMGAPSAIADTYYREIYQRRLGN